MVTGATDQELHAGLVLGPYELLVPVGSGGMAQVWAARQRSTGHVYALKMLLPHLTENASFRDMFFDEARIASRIHHENVCETYELVDLEGILTIVMEWVDGASLVRVLRPGPDDREDHPAVALPIRHAVKIVGETCAGLDAAHNLVDENGRSMSVVHRDVSPHNILLNADGRVKVTDFGVAKALGKLNVTISGQVKGKLAYMSPEQLVGGGIDRRSDVFALGSVLYEATTGRKPFQGDHDPQVMTAIIIGNMEPPSALVRNYPRDLEAIILKAMATSPDDRHPTAMALKQALDGWLMTSGPVLGAQQIAVLLHERCGQQLVRRAQSVSMPPPQAPLSPHVLRVESGGGMEIDRRSRPSERKTETSMILAACAMLIGMAAGLGVLFYVHEIRKHRVGGDRADRGHAVIEDAGAPPAPPPTSAPSATHPPVPVPMTTAVTIGDLDDAVDTVKIHVPDGARIYVNGQELPSGSVGVARPEAGVLNVVVRADGKNDAVVVVDPHSAENIDVTMTRKRRLPAPPQPPSTTSGASMPPNPYD